MDSDILDPIEMASADEVRIYHGDRIAQGELIKTYDYELEETGNIPEKSSI